MRVHGLNNACADGTAINQLRHDNTELFADVLIDEIRLCVGETEPPGASAACHACGSTSHRPGRYLCPQPCNQAHPRCLACGAALRQCYWSNARTTIELLTAHAPTIMAAFHDASRGRRRQATARPVTAASRHARAMRLTGNWPASSGAPPKRYSDHLGIAVTIDNKVAAAAATIAHMPEAKAWERLEQLPAGQAQARLRGRRPRQRRSAASRPDSMIGHTAPASPRPSQLAGYEHTGRSTPPRPPADTGSA